MCDGVLVRASISMHPLYIYWYIPDTDYSLNTAHISNVNLQRAWFVALWLSVCQQNSGIVLYIRVLCRFLSHPHRVYPESQ